MPELSEHRKMVQCETCLETFAADMETCPVCGSVDLAGYKVQNPFSRLPMERVLPVARHIVWILGIFVCFVLLWNTNTEDAAQNWLMALSGFAVLFFSTIVSVTLFGIGELLKRVIRIQRRVRAFMVDLNAERVAGPINEATKGSPKGLPFLVCAGGVVGSVHGRWGALTVLR